jgi:predicted ArsR family transcriptional regulator
MAKTKTTAADAVLKAVKRAPKKGISAKTIAERTGVKLGTVRSYLYALQTEGYIQVVDTVRTGQRGRPQLLYVSA